MLSHHKFQRIAVSEMCLKTPGPLLIDDCQAWPRVGVKEEDKEHRVGRKGEQATASGGGALQLHQASELLIISGSLLNSPLKHFELNVPLKTQRN